jgi:hypothetical protein
MFEKTSAISPEWFRTEFLFEGQERWSP